MRLPSGPLDGAGPRERVILALRTEGAMVVEDNPINPTLDGMVRVCKGSIVRAYHLPSKVNRELLKQIAHEFGINRLAFYYSSEQLKMDLGPPH